MQPDHLPAQFLLIGALLATAWSLLGAWRWWRGNAAARRSAALGAYLAAGLMVWAFGVLLAAFIASDFRYEAVVGYSSRGLPLLYKISAVWAGQEGSLLLWGGFASVLALALLRMRPQSDPLALSIYQAGQLGYLAILVSESPFRQMAAVPPDGQGLNPLLQDPWMATHPPVVFLGYAAAALPFALALAALWRGERGEWLARAIRWNLVTVLTLGAGILLGAFWAYEVLGWGGYWGWDPVENSSLIPWITSVALLHGMLVQRRTGALVRWNTVLALGTYVLVLYATYLTRSGVLSAVSVHSFPQGGISGPLLTLLAALIGVSAISLAVRWRSFAGEPLSWRLELGTILSITMGLLLVSAGVILLGTSWPIVSMWFGEPIGLKPAFYNQASLPIYVVVAALMVAAPLLGWKVIPFRRLARVSVVPVVTGFATLAWASFAGFQRPLYLALMLFSGAAIGSCLVRAVRMGRISVLRMGAPVAHAGMALVLLGVLVSSVGERREEVRLPRGESRPALGQVLRFDGTDGGGGFRVVVEPQGAAIPTRLELVAVRGEQVQRKPAIVRRLEGDIYLSPIDVERAPRLVRRAVLRQGEPAPVGDVSVMFEGFSMTDHQDGMVVGARLRLEDGSVVEPTMRMGPGGAVTEPATLPGNGGEVRLAGIRVEAREVILEARPVGAPTTLFIEASWKPGMNLLWGGSILLCLGTGTALGRRALRAHEEAREMAETPARPRRRQGLPPATLHATGGSRAQ